MAIASNSMGPGCGEVSGLNCHAVLSPIDAAVDEAWTSASPYILATSLTVTSFCYVGGGHDYG